MALATPGGACRYYDKDVAQHSSRPSYPCAALISARCGLRQAELAYQGPGYGRLHPSRQLHQQGGEQLRPRREARDQNVLRERVRTGPADAVAIERGDTEGAGEVRIRAATRTFMLQVDP